MMQTCGTTIWKGSEFRERLQANTMGFGERFKNGFNSAPFHRKCFLRCLENRFPEASGTCMLWRFLIVRSSSSALHRFIHTSTRTGTSAFQSSTTSGARCLPCTTSAYPSWACWAATRWLAVDFGVKICLLSFWFRWGPKYQNIGNISAEYRNTDVFWCILIYVDNFNFVIVDNL